MGIWSGALRFLEYNVKNCPDNRPLAQNYLGNTYLQVKRYDDAEKEYKLIQKTYKYIMEPDINLRTVYWLTDRLDERRSLNKARIEKKSQPLVISCHHRSHPF